METGSARAGFTLLEVLLVLALMAFMSSLFIGGVNIVANRYGSRDAEQVFWEAVRQASLDAILSRQPVRLSFNDEEKSFMWTREGLQERLRVQDAPKELGVQFLQPQTQGGDFLLIGGRLVETRELSSVLFYPDGTCTPFRLQIVRGGMDRQILRIDPWTCAPILETAAEAR